MNNANQPIKIIQISKPTQPNPTQQINNQNIQRKPIQQVPPTQQQPAKPIKPYVAPPIKIDFPENPSEDDKKDLVQRFNNSISNGKSDEALEIMLLMIKNDIRIRE